MMCGNMLLMLKGLHDTKDYLTHSLFIHLAIGIVSMYFDWKIHLHFNAFTYTT